MYKVLCLFVPLVGILSFSLSGALLAADFTASFEWGKIKRCTSGFPGAVPNPIFTFTGIPSQTVKLKFRMQDLNAPGYNHGGGTIAWDGEDNLEAGSFTYMSPCPPGGRHTYKWTIKAIDSNGDVIATAYAKKQYP